MSNSYLNGLLAKSKFAQLARSNQLMKLRTSKTFPTAQTLETSTGSFKQRDYGLKSALPQRPKRSRIVVDEVDTIENMIAYERAPGDYYRKLKFNELNIPIAVRQNSLYQKDDQNPLFFDLTKDRVTEKEDLSRSKFSELLNINLTTLNSTKEKLFEKLQDQRSNFLKYLAENSPEKYISIRKGDVKSLKIDDEIVEFLIKLNKEESFAPAKPLSKIAQNEVTRPILKATGGLSFKLKGKLELTPNGVEKPGRIVPARILKSSGDSYQMAVGGIVAQASPLTLGNMINIAGKDRTKHVSQQAVPVRVTYAQLGLNGALQLKVEGVQHKTTRSAQKGAFQIPSLGAKSLEVNEDTIFNLLKGYSKLEDQEI